MVEQMKLISLDLVYLSLDNEQSLLSILVSLGRDGWL